MKKRIVCFGDSNTWGYIPVTGERYDETIRWPARLQEMLGCERCTVVEEGLTGRTTVFDDPFDPELNGMKSMPAVLRTAAPIDVLVFMLGTNDFQSHIPAGNAVSTARAVQYMLETARKLGVGRPGGEMQILLISPRGDYAGPPDVQGKRRHGRAEHREQPRPRRAYENRRRAVGRRIP